MSTDHIGDQAVPYWTGELKGAARASIDAHLGVCAACRDELAQVRIALGAVASWPREPVLDPGIERRILARLDVNRLHVATETPTGPRRRWWRSRAAATLVVGLASAAAGFVFGRMTGAAPRVSEATPASPRADSSLHAYLLLLEEPVWPPGRPLTRTGYGEWARAIAAEARFVGAEKLTEEPGYRVTSDGRVARPDGTVRPPNVSGWYVVRAGSYEEAIRWARRGPHLSYGSVLVREIEETPRTVR